MRCAVFFCLCACEFVHVEGKNVAYAKRLFEHLDEVHCFFYSTCVYLSVPGVKPVFT